MGKRAKRKRGRKNAWGLGRDQAPAPVLFSRSLSVRADPVLSESLEQASSLLANTVDLDTSPSPSKLSVVCQSQRPFSYKQHCWGRDKQVG